MNNPSQRTYGLSSNSLRGPDLINVDLALAKTTAITERVSLEFRVEYFNALNHPEFAQPTVPNNATNINSSLLDRSRRPALSAVRLRASANLQLD